jgi:tRNA(adenine34) deaminase
MNQDEKDLGWMAQAIELARRAGNAGEVPIGAVVVQDDVCIGAGWNRPIAMNDPSAHAEIEALRAAGARQKNYRLPGATLYVTIEPCAMCAGAIVQARLKRVVYGAADPKAGAAGSVFDLLRSKELNHQARVDRGVLEADCAELLQEFFRARRQA